VTGYHELRALLRDPRIGVRMHQPPKETGAREGFYRARAEAMRAFATVLSERAPEDHRRLRRIVSRAFTPAEVAARRARIQEIVDERIDIGLERGTMDVLGELGRPLALKVGGELMGLPRDYEHEWAPILRELGYRIDVTTLTPSRAARGILAATALASRLRELIRTSSAPPESANGLLWEFEQSRARGEMSEAEVVGNAVVLAFATHATTQHLISNGLLSLLRNRAQWELLCEQPQLVDSAVEELLRYETPAAVALRLALDDVEIIGVTIRRGDPIMFVLAAANRDPAVFEHPDQLDITRNPNPHLGFGGDAHYCLGAALARLEAQVAIGTLARRAPQLRLAATELEWEDTVSIRGLKHLPVRF
jgi:cytochrome P450